MRTPFLIPLAGACLALLPAIAAADTATVRAQERESQLVQSDARLSGEAAARAWHLTDQEWQRYQTLMQGPRGIYSPGLDPLTALGTEARSDDERRHYAELQVRAEARRVSQELAYQQAYDEAWKRLYPGMAVVQLGGAAASPVTAPRGSGRLAVFVKDDCPRCIERVKALQAQKTPFDLYMVGSQGADEQIRRWAVLAGVEPARVRTREITLNHDGGRWVSLGLGGELPAVVREVDGQWQRQ